MGPSFDPSRRQNRKIDIIATSSGTLWPPVATQPLEKGIVSAINVQDGHKVTAGQVLVELDRTPPKPNASEWSRI